jgi:DNA-binding MarR family transcriptional regulator
MPESHSDLVLLYDAVARIHGRLRESFAAARAGSGLSDIEHTVLAAVVEAQRPPTVPQIGRALGHPRQVIQRAANALEASGLIAFTANPDHKRAALLVATGEGRTVQAAANRRAARIAAELRRRVHPGDLHEATRLLTSIREALSHPAEKEAA